MILWFFQLLYNSNKHGLPHASQSEDTELLAVREFIELKETCRSMQRLPKPSFQLFQIEEGDWSLAWHREGFTGKFKTKFSSSPPGLGRIWGSRPDPSPSPATVGWPDGRNGALWFLRIPVSSLLVTITKTDSLTTGAWLFITHLDVLAKVITIQFFPPML